MSDDYAEYDCDEDDDFTMCVGCMCMDCKCYAEGHCSQFSMPVDPFDLACIDFVEPINGLI